MTPTRRHRRAGDRGSIPTELALVTPAVLVLLMLVIVTGRLVDGNADVQNAAAAAARAAALRSSPAGAAEAAEDTATANLAAGTRCQDVEVTADAAGLKPGGSVSVTVACTVDLSDIALLAVPGQQRFTATATEAVDTYRGAGPGPGSRGRSSGGTPPPAERPLGVTHGAW